MQKLLHLSKAAAVSVKDEKGYHHVWEIPIETMYARFSPKRGRQLWCPKIKKWLRDEYKMTFLKIMRIDDFYRFKLYYEKNGKE